MPAVVAPPPPAQPELQMQPTVSRDTGPKGAVQSLPAAAPAPAPAPDPDAADTRAPAAPVEEPTKLIVETGMEQGRSPGADGGVAGGVPGGVAGGVPGGVAGGLPGVPLAGSGGSGPVRPAAVRVGPQMKAPRKIKDARPIYPESALSARARASVFIEALIGADGKVQEARVLHSVPAFDQPALDAVRQWEYEPPLLNGVPVAVILTVIVNFALQ